MATEGDAPHVHWEAEPQTRSQELADFAFDHAAVGIAQLTPDGHVARVNQTLCHMLGYSAKDLLSRSYNDIVHSGDASVTVRSEDKIDNSIELQAYTRDGRQLNILATEAPVLDNDGNTIFRIVSLRDITGQRIRQEETAVCQKRLAQLTHQLLERERQATQSIAKSLHDHLAQSLAAMRLYLDLIEPSHATQAIAPVVNEYRQVSMLLDQAIHGLRQMLTDLRPPLLAERGLIAALDSEVRLHTAENGKTDVLLEINAASTARWPSNVEYHAFMIAREAMTNALRHARATLIRVIVAGDAQRLALEVIDDGSDLPTPGYRVHPEQLGLTAMRERAAAVGGKCTVHSIAKGGTRVFLVWEAPV